MRILLLLLIAISARAQEVSIVQYSSFCEEVSALGGYGVYRERIVNIQRNDDGGYLVTAIIVRQCGLPVVPLNAEMDRDTLTVKTAQPGLVKYQFENGKEVSQVYNGEDCNCAFNFRIEVAVDTLSYISIDGKFLDKTEEKYVTYPKRYFVFRGDTTGYEDEYGRRQGYYLVERKKDILKSLYKDGNQVSCELLTLQGKLIAKEKDCYLFIEKTKK